MEWYWISERILVKLGFPEFSSCLLHGRQMQKFRKTVFKTKCWWLSGHWEKSRKTTVHAAHQTLQQSIHSGQQSVKTFAFLWASIFQWKNYLFQISTDFQKNYKQQENDKFKVTQAFSGRLGIKLCRPSICSCGLLPQNCPPKFSTCCTILTHNFSISCEDTQDWGSGRVECEKW